VNVGDRVIHPRLGMGTILEIGTRGCIVDYSNEEGVLVRGTSFHDLTLVKQDEQETAKRNETEDRVSQADSRASEAPGK